MSLVKFSYRSDQCDKIIIYFFKKIKSPTVGAPDFVYHYFVRISLILYDFPFLKLQNTGNLLCLLYKNKGPLNFYDYTTVNPKIFRKIVHIYFEKLWRCGGLNPGPFTCKANALPLSYIPCDHR